MTNTQRVTTFCAGAAGYCFGMVLILSASPDQIALALSGLFIALLSAMIMETTLS